MHITKSLLAAALLVGLASPLKADERVSIGTGGTGGLFYVIGAGMADVINRHLEGTTARAEVTGASVENIRRVSADQLTVGFSSGSTLYEAKHGTGAFDGEPMPVASITYLHPAALQLATTADTGVTKVEDLEGKRINLGPPGSNSAVLARRVLEAYGIFDPSNVEFLSYVEGTNALMNGTIAATFVLAGPPTGALVDLDAQRDMVVLPIEPDKVQSMFDEYPYYKVFTLKAGTYPDQTEDVTTVNDPAIMFTKEDADPALVEALTKTIYENIDELHQVHPQAKAIGLDSAQDVPVDLHPAAKAYYDSVK